MHNQVISALKSGDTAQARAALDRIAPELGTVLRARLEARIALAEDRPEAAIAALAAFTDRPDPVHTRLRLQAFLAMGDAVSAAGAVQDLPDDEPLSPSLENALTLGLLQAERGDLMAALLPRMRPESSQMRKRLRRIAQAANTTEEQDRAARFLEALHPVLATPLPPMEAAGVFLRAGRTDLADRQLDGFNTIITRIDQSGADPFHPDEPRWNISQDKAERILDWLDIPAQERGLWRQGFVDASRARDAMTIRLLHDQQTLSRFVQNSEADVRLLHNAQRGGILAVSHTGLLMGVLCHLIDQKVQVKILGGDSALAHVLPGAQILVPVRRTHAPSSALRSILRELKAGRLAGIAADAGKSDRAAQITHRGQRFSLPTTVPELAFKQNVPIYWTDCHRENGRYVCRARLGPSPEPGETMPAFVNRWHHFILDELHAICRADPLNLCLHPDMLVMPNDGPATRSRPADTATVT